MHLDGNHSLTHILLEHAQEIRRIARAFGARANNHIACGRWKEAWDDILTVKRLGGLAAQGHALVEGLVGLTVTATACHAAHQFVAAAGPGDVDWESLRGTWTLGPISDVARTVGITERAVLIQLACDIWDQPDPNAMLLQGIATGPEEAEPTGIKLIAQTLREMLTNGEVDLDDVLRHANESYDAGLKIVTLDDAAAREEAFRELEARFTITIRGEPNESSLSTLTRELGSHPKNPAEQFSRALLNLVFPATEQVVRAEHRTRASLNLVDLAMAARQYQARTGHLPQSLQELEPLVEAATMNQPAVDEPIALRPDGEGIILYHWSRDRVDDGGDIDGPEAKDWGLRLK